MRRVYSSGLAPSAAGGVASSSTVTIERKPRCTAWRGKRRAAARSGGFDDGWVVFHTDGVARRRREGREWTTRERDTGVRRGAARLVQRRPRERVAALRVRAVVEQRGDERLDAVRGGLEGDGTFFHRLPTADVPSSTGQACKNSTYHWPCGAASTPRCTRRARASSCGRARLARRAPRPPRRARARP